MPDNIALRVTTPLSIGAVFKERMKKMRLLLSLLNNKDETKPDEALDEDVGYISPLILVADQKNSKAQAEANMLASMGVRAVVFSDQALAKRYCDLLAQQQSPRKH